MEKLLLDLMYFIRPVMSMFVDVTVFGFVFADIATMVFTLGLIVLFIMSSMENSQAKPMSTIEKWMGLYILWSTLASLYHLDIVDFRTYIKWILPLLTYMVMRRSISDRFQYQRLLVFMVIGFSVPVVLSAYKTVSGLGLHRAIYWTGLERYQGVYAKVHDLAHNMGFLLMVLTILYFITKGDLIKKGKIYRKGRVLAIACLVLMALYDMYSAQVRTVYVGIVLFGLVVLYQRSKKGLALYVAVGVFTVMMFSATIYTIFFDVIDAVEGKQGPVAAGSGRFEIWAHNLDVYSRLSIPEMILGVGIGNKYGTVDMKSIKPGQELVYDSHNDWLSVLIEIGPPGLFLMLGIYWSFYNRIRRLEGGEKAVYFSLLFAVVIMNMASNSYLTRFPLAQMFYMLMVYLELPSPNKITDSIAVVEKNYPRILSRKKKLVQ